MKQRAQIALMIFLALALFACAPVTPATLEAATQPAATSALTYHPLTVRSGMAKIDSILDAVASDDVQRLRSLIEFTEAECTQREGFGGPPKCREGDAEGTPVEALPFLGAEGGHLRKDELEGWPGIDASGLYGIYENSSDVYEDEFFPAGEHTILLAGSRDGQPIALRIGDSGIVRIDYLFDFGRNSLEDILQREAANMILAPPTR